MHFIKDAKAFTAKHKSTGLFLGFFDPPTYENIQLFKLAKHYVDYIMLGIDNDLTGEININPQRRIYNQQERYDFVTQIRLVDFAFIMDFVADFSHLNVADHYEKMFAEIKPSAVLSNVLTDSFASKKRELCEKVGIEFIPLTIEI